MATSINFMFARETMYGNINLSLEGLRKTVIQFWLNEIHFPIPFFFIVVSVITRWQMSNSYITTLKNVLFFTFQNILETWEI